MYFVYILVCLKSGRSYVGQTANLIHRFHRHQAGLTRTTREKLTNPVMLHWEPCATRHEALQRERYYKSGSGHRRKHELIARVLPELWPLVNGVRSAE
ncbi:GIY-YIG nuclease family protein [Synoicihabitans lomoniglobus]|uniref:GIY-YIG nuclease family protein n=1 Tax=Synoicihabitans lomoniglobus TaxID=2909285 RepID=A0AAF0I343_9BACT|nr:GIY-YIG nuclease family protein [Opitutaceae bacterium LMO-M01]WED66118.1 GIY-YIG nuclease family protein [Opitutaceae bacterium LMO-M01]